MTATQMINSISEIWGAIFLLICSCIVYATRKSEPKRSKWILLMLYADVILLGADAIAWIFQGDPTTLGFWMVRIGNCLVFLMMPVMVLLAYRYFLTIVRANGCKPAVYWTIIIVTISLTTLFMALINPFTHIIYSFDQNNTYFRCSHFWTFSLLNTIALVAMGCIIICYHEFLSRLETAVFLLYVLMPFVTSLIQLKFYGLNLNNPAITIILFLIFMTHEMEMAQRLQKQEISLMEARLHLAEQETELARKDTLLLENNVKLMRSQIQPHFIFNSLASCEQLCLVDSQLAAKAIHRFAKYLRTNLDAMSKMSTVSFSEELEHIRTYIWLEKMRFGDDLNYVEDLQADDFLIPTLSVQPLVENSIKHGMMNMAEGVLTVTLSTREEEDKYIIIVEDSGEGFDTSLPPQDEKAHIGLINVKSRLQHLSKGTLELVSAVGSGTTVTITIPK